MRLLTAAGMVGIWDAAAALGGPTLLTAACTLAAAGLGAWALAVLRGR